MSKIKVKITGRKKDKIEPDKTEKQNNKELILENVDFEKHDKDKKMVIITGVTFFMVLIFGFWLLNIKHIFKFNSSEINNNKINFIEMRKELDNATIKIKEGINEIKKMQTASSSLQQANQAIKEKDNIDLLKQHLTDKVLSEQATNVINN